jgi:hypothetical protein
VTGESGMALFDYLTVGMTVFDYLIVIQVDSRLS